MRDTLEGSVVKKVITYGTYDLFHEGHYNLLKHAKELGDYLIVGVTTEHFDQMRGKMNVVDPIMTRIENVKKTGFADEIIVEDHEGQKIEDIQNYDIDIFTVGSDWVGKFDYLNAYCQVKYLPRTPDISSTLIREKTKPIIKIGVIGSGRMAPRFIEESKYVSGVYVKSVYNPIAESAKAFEEHQKMPVMTENFEGFIQAVDAVYIASPNETHYDYAKFALKQGKHVLSEKPLAFTHEKTMELYTLASENSVVLMEGIRTAYAPSFQHLIHVAKSGVIGEIKDVEATFTRLANPESRERTDAAYGGAFLEFAGYTMLPIFKLLGLDFERVTIDSIKDKNGLDIYTKMQFRYPDGMATAKMGVGVKSEGDLVIAGTEGYIIAPSPWWLTKRFDIRYEDATKIDHYDLNFKGDGLRYELSEFVKKINKTGKKDYKLTAEESIRMADVVEEFMRQERGMK